MRSSSTYALAGALCAVAGNLAYGQIDARMLRQPTVSSTQIAFVYGGDIWIMPKAGGTAQRLTTARGEESFPRFSPSGSEVAFTGNYDGNEDVYVMPAIGGEPRRVTYHPAPDRVVDWYPDGKSLLIASSRTSETNRYNKLFKISKDGGIPAPLPMPYGEFASLSPDANTVAYLPEAVDARTWKRYRGGWAPDIWFFDLKQGTARNITHDEANDGAPMWHGTTLYFLSDRGKNLRSNIWAYDTQKNSFRQITTFDDFDVKYPSIGPSDIVFQAGDRLYLVDLSTEKMREVPVQVVTDRSTLRPRVQNVGTEISAATISPTGKRAGFEAHGDIFTVPAENGMVHDLTATSGSAERTPDWSPDGKSVAYWSDKTGEYELTIRNADGSGTERTVTHLGPGFRYQPHWSPDSRKIAFIDKAMQIQVADVATGEVSKVDKALNWQHGQLSNFRVSWSPDSRWLAYGRDLMNGNTAIFIYDVRSGGASHQVTSGYFRDNSPKFDPDGKYLYFLSGRSLNPSYSDLDNSFIYANSTNILVATLRKDLASPLAPRNDEEATAADATPPGAQKVDSTQRKAQETLAAAAPAAAAKPLVRDVAIDFADFERRAELLPVPAGNYSGLTALQGKVLFRRGTRTGATGGPAPLVYFDLNDRDEKTVLDNVNGFVASADGKKLLVSVGPDFYIIDPRPAQKVDPAKKLVTASMSMTVDPSAEWHQMFNDAWRIERDYFYDPGMHGVNWNAMRTRYGKLIDDAVSRWDVTFVIGELIGELNSSHTYVQGGQTENAPRRGVGLLGADYAVENGALRITHIVDGGVWDSEVRSPLLHAGVNVKTGDYLLAVNGKPIDLTQEPAAAFDGLAGAVVAITVNDKPTLAGSRVVLVKPLGDESRLRNLAWIEANRKRVDEATHGRVGYVYVPSTGIDGQTELVRQYRAQIDKDGMIIDERFNSGGQIPDRFVELLNRPVTNYWKTRDGIDQQWPPVANPGPKVMLINGWSGSGGDAFPYYFKQAGLGPLIGRRTWGGLIGISGTPALVDGGSVTAPSFAIFSKEGQWIIESHGVDPDIDVVDDPAQLAKGVDPQLERAIQEALTRVEKNPKRAPAPAYPKRIVPTE
ncbi:MAG TPA: PDZ domain-containing protein [Gemmatimonadaceae bacterium]